MTLKEKFMRFMYGRYGVDTLGKYSLGAGLATMVLSIVFDSYTLSLLSWFFIILTYFRMFSRNLYKRSSENQTFLNKTYKLRTWFGKQKNMMAQRKTHHIYR